MAGTCYCVVTSPACLPIRSKLVPRNSLCCIPPRLLLPKEEAIIKEKATPINLEDALVESLDYSYGTLLITPSQPPRVPFSDAPHTNGHLSRSNPRSHRLGVLPPPWRRTARQNLLRCALLLLLLRGRPQGSLRPRRSSLRPGICMYLPAGR